MHQLDMLELYRQLRPDERVFLAFVPYELNEKDFIGDNACVRMKWSESRSFILCVIEDQEESCKIAEKCGQLGEPSWRISARQEMYCAMSALRLHGVEATEFWAKWKYERMKFSSNLPSGRWSCELSEWCLMGTPWY